MLARRAGRSRIAAIRDREQANTSRGQGLGEEAVVTDPVSVSEKEQHRRLAGFALAVETMKRLSVRRADGYVFAPVRVLWSKCRAGAGIEEDALCKIHQADERHVG